MITNKHAGLSRFSSFKIVFIYTLVSAFYIYTSDYFLEKFIHDIDVLTRMQTYKGIVFILITASLLYVLVKRNLGTTTAYYQKIIDVKQQSDAQLMQINKEYLTLFNHSPVPMWLVDLETLQFLLVNDAACSIYQYTPEEYLKMTLREIRPATDIPMLEELLAAMPKDTGWLVPIVVRHQKKNGELMQVKVKTSFVYYGGARVMLVSADDISAEIEMQNKLLAVNEKLKAASEVANLGYWSNDLVNSEIQWSDELYKIFEVDPQTFELNLDNIKSHFLSDDQASFSDRSFEKFADHFINETERKIITAAGKTKWILERQYLVRDKENNPVRLEGIALDITRRKLHEQEVWESNERFKLLTKATVEAIIDWDIKNDTVFWGEGFSTMLGFDLSKNDKLLWVNNIHPDDKKRVLLSLYRSLKDVGKLTFNEEFRFLKADGQVSFMQHRGVFVRDAQGVATRALGAMIDLTETLNRMQRIERQNLALREIAWTQSHIVRAPLTNLMGLIGLLKDKRATVSEELLIQYIGESAQKLDDIIHDIVHKTAAVEDV